MRPVALRIFTAGVIHAGMALTALVTGASAGLGTEFARLFAADKHDLVLVARRRERLDELAKDLRARHGVRVEVIALDLGTPDAAARLCAELDKLGVTIDFLVNNAGFGSTGAFVELDAARELQMIHLNITTLVALTRALLPGMVARKRGRVLNIGSTAGFQPGPFMATYYASKAFVNSFTEALWYELKGTGVTATVSCPGATATEFAGAAGNESSRLFRMGAASAAEVARQAYRAMHAGKPMIVHGLKNKLAMLSLRFSPRAAVRAVAAALNKDPSRQKQLPA
jgi:hypothetical protein